MDVIPSPSKDLAVKYALSNNWEKAYKENLKLLDENPGDIDSLNRIAHALIKLGRFRKAKTFYQKVLNIDKTNPIALKNLKRLITANQRKEEMRTRKHGKAESSDAIRLEEAGKTK